MVIYWIKQKANVINWFYIQHQTSFTSMYTIYIPGCGSGLAEGAPVVPLSSLFAAFSILRKLASNSTGSMNFFLGNGGGPKIASTSLKLSVSFFISSSASCNIFRTIFIKTEIYKLRRKSKIAVKNIKKRNVDTLKVLIDI